MRCTALLTKALSSDRHPGWGLEDPAVLVDLVAAGTEPAAMDPWTDPLEDLVAVLVQVRRQNRSARILPAVGSRPAPDQAAAAAGHRPLEVGKSSWQSEIAKVCRCRVCAYVIETARLIVDRYD